jgi:ATP-dependent RNA helicase RhlE
MPFEALGLRPELLSAIATQGYTAPAPIQSQAIAKPRKAAKAKAQAKSETSRMGKIDTAPAAPKLGRRLSRSKPGK